MQAGKDEQAQHDPDDQVVRRAGPMTFQVEQVLAGPEHRLDALADGREVGSPLRFGRSGRADDDAYSGQFGHPVRLNPATWSGAIRPPGPIDPRPSEPQATLTLSSLPV